MILFWQPPNLAPAAVSRLFFKATTIEAPDIAPGPIPTQLPQEKTQENYRGHPFYRDQTMQMYGDFDGIFPKIVHC